MIILFKIVRRLCCLTLQYPLLVISYLIPRNKKLWIFGSYNDSFTDNSKYLFIEVNSTNPDIEAVWVTGNKSLVKQLTSQGYKAYYRWSLSGVLKSIRGRVYVFNSYVSDINYWTSGGVVLINLWHGIPLKKIEYDIKFGLLGKKYNSNWTCLYKIIYPNYFKKPTFFLSTSPQVSNLFCNAFRIQITQCLDFGYPRTDLFFKPLSEVIAYIRDSEPLMYNYYELMKPFEKTIIYMPTFRESGTNNINDILDMSELNYSLSNSNTLLFIKQHSNISNCTTGHYSNIVFLHSSIDVYPLLPFTTALITDYSSIFCDYLLLNKPIIFYAFDKEDYLSGERGFYFNYDDFVPGDIVESFEMLLQAIKSIDEQLCDKRDSIKNMLWDKYCGQSSVRLISFINQQL